MCRFFKILLIPFQDLRTTLAIVTEKFRNPWLNTMLPYLLFNLKSNQWQQGAMFFHSQGLEMRDCRLLFSNWASKILLTLDVSMSTSGGKVRKRVEDPLGGFLGSGLEVVYIIFSYIP